MKAASRYVPVSSDFLSTDELESVIQEYAPAFENAGVARVSADGLLLAGRLVVFVVTGGTEERVLELVEARAETRAEQMSDSDAVETTREPVLLVAYPGRNSLPAALEVLARLQQDGMAGRIVFLDGPGDVAGVERLRVAVGAGETHGSNALCEDLAPGDLPRAPDPSDAPHTRKPPGRPLAGRRIGLVGEPSDWLVASSPSPEIVRGVWGAEVVEIGMGELRTRVDAGVRVSAEFFAQAYRSWASRVSEPTGDDLVASGAIYVALRSFVDELELDAISVRCFDLVLERGATGCLALSRLADQGIVAGCEGDLPSAIAMLWIRERLGETSWMANPARANIATNTLTLAHCTVPCSMADGFELRSHFESGLGAAVQGNLAPGPVTLVRIGGRGLDRVWLAEGEITAHGTDETMCRTQVEVALRDADGADLGRNSGDGRPRATVTELLERPLGNHIVLVRGWVADALLGHGQG